ncbi:DUF6089 family protein [Reichenbachiella versicolor]|uniref:DUF6089 family protein n=1 Tax=Reichenbachiella versicolor TaxID=1821036 RepID=UPI000D6E1DA6|nr:DUF6089 family protein [Reichenbachiella versicolor]
MIRKITLLIVLVFGLWTAHAQSFMGWQLRDRYFSTYAGTGFSGYFGDLTNNHPMSNGLSNFNFGIEARLFYHLSARVQYTYYRIEGSDSNAKDSTYNRQRNLSFQSKNHEWSIQGVYYLFKYGGKYYKRKTYEPYVYLGVGQTFYNPKAKYNGTWYDLREIETEGNTYGKSTIVLPTGLGVKMTLNEFMNLGIDFGYRFTFTKHLDDVADNYSTNYETGTVEGFLSNRSDQIPVINQEALSIMSPGASRGNGKTDGYLLVNFNIEIYLPGDLFQSKKGRKEKIIGK